MEFIHKKNWQELMEKLISGELHVGIFDGFEFAWARERYPTLKAMALAINVHRYPTASLVVNRGGAIKNFDDLKGGHISVPATSQRFTSLFIERHVETKKETLENYFSKVDRPENLEDALDDVVDGVVQAAVTDIAALEAFQRRKPGRFAQLTELIRSAPFPPVVIACYGKGMDFASLKRFEVGLCAASKKEKGQMVLTLLRLSGFELLPSDFNKVLAATLQTYPETSLHANLK